MLQIRSSSVAVIQVTVMSQPNIQRLNFHQRPANRKPGFHEKLGSNQIFNTTSGDLSYKTRSSKAVKTTYDSGCDPFCPELVKTEGVRRPEAPLCGPSPDRLASVVWNGFVHPPHVGQASVLHGQAEHLWVGVRVERPWRDTDQSSQRSLAEKLLVPPWPTSSSRALK